MFAGAVAAAAFNDDHGKPLGFTGGWIASPPPSQPTATDSPTAGPTAVATDATPRPTRTPDPSMGFAYPIEGACLPEGDDLMPGALRAYRNGIHEGVDFYDIDNCAEIGLDTEVVAAKEGIVVRADLDYVDITADEVADLESQATTTGDTPEIDDVFRGRQVWLDHGDGIITRYAHLNGIAEGIDVGERVAQGELIAYIGESGTPESVTDPGTQVHLHFEIRDGDSYLGEGLDPEQVRQLYAQAFEP